MSDNLHEPHLPSEIRNSHDPYPHFFDMSAHMQHDLWEFHVPEGIFFVKMCQGTYFCNFATAPDLVRAYHLENNRSIGPDDVIKVGSATDPIAMKAIMDTFISSKSYVKPEKIPENLN